MRQFIDTNSPHRKPSFAVVRISAILEATSLARSLRFHFRTIRLTSRSEGTVAACTLRLCSRTNMLGRKSWQIRLCGSVSMWLTMGCAAKAPIKPRVIFCSKRPLASGGKSFIARQKQRSRQPSGYVNNWQAGSFRFRDRRAVIVASALLPLFAAIQLPSPRVVRYPVQQARPVIEALVRAHRVGDGLWSRLGLG